MSGRTSRSKGRRGEAAAKRLLMERGFTDIRGRTRGEGGDDFEATKNGKTYSIEVKHTQNLMLAAAVQCRTNAHGKPRLLIWKPSHWYLPGNIFVVFEWDGATSDAHIWRSNEGRAA